MVRTIGDAITVYRTVAQANGLSPRTIEWVVTVARYFAAFVGETTPLEALGPP
jgi:hypothetical protein